MQVGPALSIAAHRPATSQSWKTWQSEEDVPERKVLMTQIFKLFSQRKPSVTAEWQEKLPDFVRRLEEALYRTASSKEDYTNQHTLEQRLQNVAKRMVSRHPAQQGRQPHPALLGLQHGQGTNQPALASTASNGFLNQLGLSSNVQQQNHPNSFSLGGRSLAQSSPQLNMQGNGFASPNLHPEGGLGLGNHGAPHHSSGSNGFMNPSLPAGGNQQISNSAQTNAIGQVPARGMMNTSHPDSGMVPSQVNSMQHIPNGLPGAAPLHPSHQNALRNPGGASAAGRQGAMIPVGAQQPSQPHSGGSMMPVVPPSPQVSSGHSAPDPGHALNSDVLNGHMGNGQHSLAGLSAEQRQELQQKKEYVAKQQRWLLFLRHCAKCTVPEGQCQYSSSCTVAKQLWRHILNCADPDCSYPRCVSSRELLKHHQKCQSSGCPVCTPVKQYVQRQRMMIQSRENTMQRQHNLDGRQLTQVQLAEQQRREQQQAQLAAVRSRAHSGQGGMMGVGHGMAPNFPHVKMEGGPRMPPGMVPTMNGARPSSTLGPSHDEPPGKRRCVVVSEKQATSLCEAQSADDIEGHLHDLRAPNGNRPIIRDDNTCQACGGTRLTFEPPILYCSACEQRIKRNHCYFTTPAALKKTDIGQGVWCQSCYTSSESTGLSTVQEAGAGLRGLGKGLNKADLEKRKNDEEQEEAWVQCDACSAWVHQICGMFNKGRNSDNVSYVCPMCLLDGLRKRERKPITNRPQALLDARDIQRTDLSDFLENRLRTELAKERAQRAAGRNLSPHQVETAEGLTIRVVNNVSQRLDVKAHFSAAFQAEGYPDGFKYQQKVICLFQRFDGMDVLLYTIYVQEYGDNDNCGSPNKKWVYLSYLDSVQYLKPNVPAADRGGLRLRTMVYHELLIGYLDYIKAHGFTSMFIWACPPTAGDDYILHVHPKEQKLPRSDRLRDWYLQMLRRAKAQGIVVHLSNLFDTFFEGGKDHRLPKCSIKDLPYFEGDFWPGEADKQLQLLKDEEAGGGPSKKMSKKAGKGSGKGNGKGKRYGLAGATADEQILSRIGTTIHPMREDFIVVHLREPCTSCRRYISGEPKYFHPDPPHKSVSRERTFEGISLDTPGASGGRVVNMSRLQLCQQCYEKEKAIANGSQQPPPAKLRALVPPMTLNDLQQQEVEAIPQCGDNNADIPSEFFVDRRQFLSLCQGNRYQFDTLRRAKHSSMMVLYHVHNPEAPAFVATCNPCGGEIEPGFGWRCTVCQDFDICTKCKNLHGHPHQLKAHAQKMDETRSRVTEEERVERQQQLARTMNLLVHASSCMQEACLSSNCAKVKKLFQHAVSCPAKVTGGCQLCKRMWALLQLHAKQCTCSIGACPVPRCNELRELRRRQLARQEEQRRTAYVNTLRHQKEHDRMHPGEASSSR
ncbi:hypothetical protein WJX84_010523 [Apatococcus fuscideae]|uniref:histone acetyltransferase n=1 Tax=Apatococcus fuscideae TaxID=2026836 RepID=A0AAW1TAE6_9CHLO